MFLRYVTKICILALVFAFFMCSCTEKHSIDRLDTRTRFVEIANSVNVFLKSIRVENERLAEIAAHLYSHTTKGLYPSGIYYRDSNNVFADHDHRSNSNVYVNSHIKRSMALEKFLSVSEQMEAHWTNVQAKHPIVGWQYMVDAATGAERSYPWYNPAQLFGGEVDFYSFDFYYDLTPDKNQSRESKWVKPTTDLSGLGWICTVSSPIYARGHFYGVQVLDITIKDIVNTYIKPHLNERNQFFFIIDNNNTIIAESEVEYIFIHDTTSHNISDAFVQLKAQFKNDTFAKQKELSRMEFKDFKLIVISTPIEELNWHFVVAEQTDS